MAKIKNRKVAAYELGILCFQQYVLVEKQEIQMDEDETGLFDHLFHALGCFEFEELRDGFMNEAYGKGFTQEKLDDMFKQIEEYVNNFE